MLLKQEDAHWITISFLSLLSSFSSVSSSFIFYSFSKSWLFLTLTPGDMDMLLSPYPSYFIGIFDDTGSVLRLSFMVSKCEIDLDRLLSLSSSLSCLLLGAGGDTYGSGVRWRGGGLL